MFPNWHLWTDNLVVRVFERDYLWLHLVSHIVLVVMPAFFVVAGAWTLYQLTSKLIISRSEGSGSVEFSDFSQLPNNILPFIGRYTLKWQIYLGLGALVTLPITYAGLELPKRIINYAIDSEMFRTISASNILGQVDYLLILCGLYLVVLLANGFLKYLLNYYKGSLSESLIRRLRYFIVRSHKRGRSKGPKDEIATVVVQEVEPVCGFSGDSFTVPLLQCGTALTIITFMSVQNIALGAAAVTMLPIQMIVIPKFQRIINKLVQQRIGLVRALSKSLNGDETVNVEPFGKDVGKLLNQLRSIRLVLFRMKYLSKALNNFLMNLTPFFFYTIGGYLVIEGQLSIGALVASLASYKDLSASVREMFAYYQSYQDARVRYDEIHKFVYGN